MVDRSVTIGFDASFDDYTASTSQAIAVTGELTAELDKLAGQTAKVGNAVSTGMIDAFARLGRVNQTAISQAAAYQQQLSSLEGAVEITSGSFEKLSKQVQGLARDVPIGIGGAVRQFETLQKVGVPTAKIEGLAKAYTDLQGATGESGQALASMGVQMARTFNSLNTRAVSDFNDALAKTTRQFGASATGTMSFATAIAPMAKNAGLAQTEVLGLSTAFSRMNEDGYRAANAVNKMLSDMDRSVREGSSEILAYANAVGMTADNFEKLYSTNPSEAMLQFLEALNEQGPDAVRTLETIGLDGVRTMRSIQTVVGQGQVREIMETAQNSYGDDSAARAAEVAYGGLNDELTKLSETMSQTVSEVGAPMLGMMEGLARSATGLADEFRKLASSGVMDFFTQAATALGLVGGIAAPVGLAVTGLGVGKGLMAGSKTGRNVAGFMANNQGKLLGAGLGGAALSLAGGGGLPGMLPLLLGAGFLGNQTTRNLAVRAGEAVYTNIGQYAGLTNRDIAAGADIRRTRASEAYRGARTLYGDRAGRISNMRAYMRASPMDYADEWERVERGMRQGEITPGQARQRMQVVGMVPSVGGQSSPFLRDRVRAAFAEGGSARALGRGVMLGGMGAARGLGSGLMALAGGPVGLAAMGGIGAGLAVYSGRQRAAQAKEEQIEEIETGDYTAAMNAYRDAVGLATVATTDLAAAMTGAAEEIFNVDQNLGQAATLTSSEYSYAAAMPGPRQEFRGTAEQQAARVLSMAGPSPDADLLQQLMLDVAASNDGRDITEQVSAIVEESVTNSTEPVGRAAGEAAARAVSSAGEYQQGMTWGGFTQANEDQLDIARQAGSAFQTELAEVAQTQGASAANRMLLDFAEGAASEVAAVAAERANQRSVEAGYGPGGYTPSFGGRDFSHAERQVYENFIMRNMGLSDEESTQFLQLAAAGDTDEAMEFYGQTDAGKAAQAEAERTERETREGMAKVFTAGTQMFEAFLPAIETFQESGESLQDYLESPDTRLSDRDRRIFEALDDPSNFGAVFAGGRALLDSARRSNMPEPQIAADLSMMIGREDAGSARRVVLEQARYEQQYQRGLQMRTMDPASARRSVIEEGRAIEAMIEREGPARDEAEATRQREMIEAKDQALLDERDAMAQQIMQIRAYQRQVTRMTEQFEIGMDRQRDQFDRNRTFTRDSFYRQRSYAEGAFFRQREYAEGAFYRQREYAQAAFQRQQEYAEHDFYLNRERAFADFDRSMRRAEYDYQLNVKRSRQDFNKGMRREAEDHAKQMRRIAEDTAKAMADPYTRLTAQQTWSIEGLLGNMEEQQAMLAEQMQTLADLRERGLSQDAIMQLGLNDPGNAMQVNRMADMTEQQIAEMNAAAGARLDLGQMFAGESTDVQRMQEDRQVALQRQAEDFQLSLERQSDDFRRNMSRTREDFHRNMDRSLTDFLVQMSRSRTEFNISQEQQMTEFNISMAQQLNEFNTQMEESAIEFNLQMDHQLNEFEISMENAREDHLRTLGYMEEDLIESQLTLQGDHATIAKAFMAALDGDMTAAGKLLVNVADVTATEVAKELGLMPELLAEEMGEDAWMFGLDDPPRQALTEMGERAAGLMADGFTEELAKKIAAYEYKIEIGEVKLPDHLTGYGGAGGAGDVGYTPSPGDGSILPAGQYRYVRGSASHGYAAVDLGAPSGTPIFAPWSGVAYPRWAGSNSYGNMTDVKGDNGLWFRAAHMVRPGFAGRMNKGDVVGYVGSTGKSSGPHLHAEVLPGGRWPGLEPSRYLKYDTGGVLPHGGGAVNLSGKPEAIITNDQWRAVRVLGDELSRINSGVHLDPTGMGVLGDIIARQVNAWEARSTRVSGYDVKYSGPHSQTFDQSTQVNGPIQVVSNDPVDLGRKLQTKARAQRAWKAGRR